MNVSRNNDRLIVITLDNDEADKIRELLLASEFYRSRQLNFLRETGADVSSFEKEMELSKQLAEAIYEEWIN